MASDSEEELPEHYCAFSRTVEELKELEGELAQLREGRHEDVLSESETKLADQVCSNCFISINVQVNFDMFTDQKKIAESGFSFFAKLLYRTEEALQTRQTHMPPSNEGCNTARADQLFDHRH